MTDLTGFISQVCRIRGSDKAIVLQQISEPDTTFPNDSQGGYEDGDPQTGIRFPETVRNGLTRTGRFELDRPYAFPILQYVKFDTAVSNGGVTYATNVRAI